jgi:DNA invertase Pin-like site-specific DNA recombinase
MTKVIGYLRVSGKDQIDGDGFHRQKESIEAFCRSNGLECHTWVREEGVSGTEEAVDRPALAALFDTWDHEHETRPEVVVVERLDRLARDLMVSECALREFRKRGVKVFAADHGAVDLANDSDDFTRTLIRQIFGALAQWEKSVLVKKLQVARARVRAATGKCEGPKKWGSRPGEKAILDEMCSLFDMGFRAKRIAYILTGKGLRKMRGKQAGQPWDGKAVRCILRAAGGRKWHGQWGQIKL